MLLKIRPCTGKETQSAQGKMMSMEIEIFSIPCLLFFFSFNLKWNFTIESYVKSFVYLSVASINEVVANKREKKHTHTTFVLIFVNLSTTTTTTTKAHRDCALRGHETEAHIHFNHHRIYEMLVNSIIAAVHGVCLNCKRFSVGSMSVCVFYLMSAKLLIVMRNIRKAITLGIVDFLAYLLPSSSRPHAHHILYLLFGCAHTNSHKEFLALYFAQNSNTGKISGILKQKGYATISSQHILYL